MSTAPSGSSKNINLSRSGTRNGPVTCSIVTRKGKSIPIPPKSLSVAGNLSTSRSGNSRRDAYQKEVSAASKRSTNFVSPRRETNKRDVSDNSATRPTTFNSHRDSLKEHNNHALSSSHLPNIKLASLSAIMETISRFDAIMSADLAVQDTNSLDMLKRQWYKS